MVAPYIICRSTFCVSLYIFFNIVTIIALIWMVLLVIFIIVLLNLLLFVVENIYISGFQYSCFWPGMLPWVVAPIFFGIIHPMYDFYGL